MTILDPIATSMCESINSELDSTAKAVETSWKTTKKTRRNLNKMLKDLNASDDFNDKLKELSDLKQPTPEEILAHIQACSCFKTNDMFRSATSIVLQLSKGVTDTLSGVIESSANPEMLIAKALKNYEGLIKGAGIPDMMKEFPKIVECLTSFCGRNVSDKVDATDQYLNDMYINSDGTVQITRLCGVNNTSSQATANIFTAYDEIENQYSKSIDSLKSIF